MVLGHSSNIELSATNIVLGGAAGQLLKVNWITDEILLIIIKFFCSNWNIILAGMTSMFTKWILPHLKQCKIPKHKKRRRNLWSFLTLVDATLCGMVSLCSGCNIIPSYGAFVIGVIAGLTYLGLEHFMIHLKLDDPLGSFAVHFGGGLVGILITPFFMKKEYRKAIKISWKFCSKLYVASFKFKSNLYS